MRALVLWLIFGLPFSAQARAEEPSALEKKGKQISVIHCSRCHVVDQKHPFTGISSTPSFELLVNALDDWEERFSSFHARLPHPSIVRFGDEQPDPDIEELRPSVTLEYEDIDALVAYAASLLKK